MLRRSITQVMLLFYASCTLLLPGGDLSLLRDLPAMYKHCKATEDKDMTPWDFVTDHLTCFDALTDEHPVGDEQRPHAPPQHPAATNTAVPWDKPSEGELVVPVTTTPRVFGHFCANYRFQHSSSVFRPPIV